MLTAEQIEARAHLLGFDLCGVAPATSHPELAFLGEWLGRGYAGTMSWLERTARRRADVRDLLPSARAVVVTATCYNVARAAAVDDADPEIALIARYARGDDYHAVVGRRLEALLAWMHAAEAEKFEARAFVDAGPVQERVYARHAGLGWIGKNCCLISPELGSWLLLGVIVCSLPLAPAVPVTDQCGACTACLEACPTGALVAPHVLDARRCLAYLTVEHRGSVALEWRPKMGRHIFGCDICQQVCPWNLDAPISRSPEWRPRPGLEWPRLVDLWARTDEELARLVEGTPMSRLPLSVLRRNLAVAIGNSGSPGGRAALAAWAGRGDDIAEPSVADPVLAEHVGWALGRGSGPLPLA